MVFSGNIEDNNLQYQFAGHKVSMSNTYHYFVNKDILRNGVHSHEYFELCFVLEGKGTFSCCEKEYNLDKNCIFVGDPLLPHEIISSEEDLLKITFFTFDIAPTDPMGVPAQNDKIIESFLHKHNGVVYDCGYIRSYFQMLSEYKMHGGSFAIDSISITMLLDVLLALCKTTMDKEDHRNNEDHTNKKNPMNNIDVHQMKQYIYDHMNENISIGHLCNVFHFSQRALFYFFQKNFEQTPNQYINSTKISITIGYLKMGYSVKQVAEMFYFSDISSYSRLFKKEKGMSPREYIKRHTL